MQKLTWRNATIRSIQVILWVAWLTEMNSIYDKYHLSHGPFTVTLLFQVAVFSVLLHLVQLADWFEKVDVVALVKRRIKRMQP